MEHAHAPSGSSRSDTEPINEFFISSHGMSINKPEAYLKYVATQCRLYQRDISLDNIVTTLQYFKLKKAPQHEFLRAYASHCANGQVFQEHTIIVEYHRYVALDTPGSLQNDYRYNGSVLFSSSSSYSNFTAKDTIRIFPSNAETDDAVTQISRQAEYCAEMRFPAGARPLNCEQLVCLMDYASTQVSRTYNPVGENCYYLARWVWHAVERLTGGRYNADALRPMGRVRFFGFHARLVSRDASGPFIGPEREVTAEHLTRWQIEWGIWSNRFKGLPDDYAPRPSAQDASFIPLSPLPPLYLGYARRTSDIAEGVRQSMQLQIGSQGLQIRSS